MAPRQTPENRQNNSDCPSLAARMLTGVVLFYRKFLSPLKPGCCRFTPTCSAYALEALRVHGALKGSWLTIRRILRCQPFGGSGYDPVPPKTEKTKKIPIKSRRTLYAVSFALFAAVLFSGVFNMCYDGPDSSVPASRTQEIENTPAVPGIQPAAQGGQTQKKINMPTRFLVWLIRLYQDKISHFLPGRCRFTPSCSVYGIQALERFGALKGSWLTIKRILRCNPWGGQGRDPVPEPEKS